MRIKKITTRDNCWLSIHSEEGQQGTFDITPYLKSEAFSELRKRSEFQKIRNGKYFIEWECGADLSADTIEAEWKTA